MGEYRLSKRQARKRLVQKERLRAGMSATYDIARRWHRAHQAVALPGEDLPSFDWVAQTPLSVAEGQKHLIRWHNGTYTMTWIGERHLEVGEWIVARTLWNDAWDGVYTSERLMHATELLDVMPANARRLYNEYWLYNRELDELELTGLLMIAPVEEESEQR